MNVYYTAEFKYKNKSACQVMSSDFVIGADASYEEVLAKANKVASKHLMEFFKDVLPDDCLPFLKNPEYVLAIPVRNLI